MLKMHIVTKLVSPHANELDVPSKTWPSFHVELLRKANDDPLPFGIQDDTQPLPVFIQDNAVMLKQNKQQLINQVE